MSRSWDSVVLGAGKSGLTAACLLARAGKRVLVLERRDVIGGTSSSDEFHPGYRTAGVLHDTRGVRRSLVAALELESCGLRLAPEPPPVYAPCGEGGGILLHHDPGKAVSEIKRFSARDAERYAAYRAFLRRIEGPVRRFLEEPPPRLFEPSLGDAIPLLRQAWGLRRLGQATMLEVLRVAPMCVADWLGEWFETPFLKAALAMPAIESTFAGPWSPGTAANLLLYECGAQGHVVGGPSALARALEHAARQRGVEIRLGSTIQEILVAEGRVTGVRLAGGEEIAASGIMASCDPRHTFLDLVSSRHLTHRFEERVRSYRGCGLTAVMRLALDGPLEFRGREKEPIPRARIGEDLDALERAFDPAKYDALPDTPSLDVYVPSLEDPSLAPPGHHVVTIHARCVPYRLAEGWMPDGRIEVERRILGTLFRHAPSAEARIVGAEFLSPVDLEAQYGLVQGHLHHGDHALDQLLVRPTPECMHSRTPVGGLLLCGGGVHPGTGIVDGPGD